MIKAYVLLPTYDFNNFYKYFDQTYLLKDIGNQLVFFTKNQWINESTAILFINGNIQKCHKNVIVNSLLA